MAAFVRVRALDELVRAIDTFGTQTAMAELTGVSVQRLNQLYLGTHSVVNVRKAMSIEDGLAVPRGTLFVAVDADLLTPYINLPDKASETDTCPHIRTSACGTEPADAATHRVGAENYVTQR